MTKGKRSGFALVMITFTCLFGVVLAVAIVLRIVVAEEWTLTTLLTAITLFYHFFMRLFVGNVVERFFPPLKADSVWFKEKALEGKWYSVLGLKKWKGNLPTYSPEKFDFASLSTQQLIDNTLQAEAVHETIAALSFLPVLLYFVTFDWVDLLVYLLTSLLGATIDTTFVFLQRFNRFRLLRLLRLQRKKTRN